MKKYIAAAAVAVMVFAFAAFAASLTVDAGTLAFGQDDVGDCGEIANVTYDHHVSEPDGELTGWVEAFFVDFPEADGACDDLFAYLVLPGLGGEVIEIGDDRATFVVRNGDIELPSGWGERHDGVSPRQGVLIEKIEEVGVTVWSDGTFDNAGHVPGELHQSGIFKVEE